MVEMAIFNVQRAITPKVGKPELWFMCSACCLIVLYIYVELCKKSLMVSVMGRIQMMEALTDRHSKFLPV